MQISNSRKIASQAKSNIFWKPWLFHNISKIALFSDFRTLWIALPNSLKNIPTHFIKHFDWSKNLQPGYKTTEQGADIIILIDHLISKTPPQDLQQEVQRLHPHQQQLQEVHQQASLQPRGRPLQEFDRHQHRGQPQNHHHQRSQWRLKTLEEHYYYYPILRLSRIPKNLATATSTSSTAFASGLHLSATRRFNF